MIQTFELVIDSDDILMEDIESNKKIGYFILFRENDALRKVVTRVCATFLGPVFETTLMSCSEERLNLVAQKDQLKDLIQKSKYNFVNYLNDYNPLREKGDLSLIQVYKQMLTKERMIYKTLNMFANRGGLLVGLVWVPKKYEDAFFEKKN